MKERRADLEARYGDRFDAALAGTMEGHRATDTGVTGFLGVTHVEVGPGWCVCEIGVTEAMFNPAGVAHGAVTAALVDHTLGVTAMPVLPPRSWPATLEFKLNYLAPVRAGVLRAVGEVRSLSARTAVVAVECTNNDRPVAIALGTIAITPPKDT
jgi:1,4-dihydroxy-2-naphthoyl-CoA hydrolase